MFWTSFLLLKLLTFLYPSKHLSRCIYWKASTTHILYIQHTKIVMHTDKFAQTEKRCGKYFKERVWSVKGCISSSARAVAFDMSAWYFDLFSLGVQRSPVYSHTPIYSSTPDVSTPKSIHPARKPCVLDKVLYWHWWFHEEPVTSMETSIALKVLHSGKSMLKYSSY